MKLGVKKLNPDRALPSDGSFVTAIGDILKISPMTVSKESLDRVHCCHSHH